MQSTQDEHFARLGVSCTLGPPGSTYHKMQLCDIEHTLCEIDKFVRSCQPNGRTKRQFKVSDSPMPEFCPPSTFADDNMERWTVSRIGGKRTRAGILYYQVFWEGYAKPTWEPAHIIKEDAPLAVKEFLDGLPSGSAKRPHDQASSERRHSKRRSNY